jgi:hypothetical protein
VVVAVGGDEGGGATGQSQGGGRGGEADGQVSAGVTWRAFRLGGIGGDGVGRGGLHGFWRCAG